MKKWLLPFLLFFISISVFAQGEAPVATTATSGTLTISATVGTTSKYYYAVWINNSTGNFIRTLTMYGYNTKYYNDLARWNAESGTNKVNAVTGATPSSVTTYTSTWNGKGQSNTTLLDDGNYTVKIEMTTEAFGTSSKLVTASFTKGLTAQTVRPTAVSPISNISIVWTPVNTAINDVELEKMYSVYPNPTVSSIFITGTDIKEVEICSLNGKSIFTSKEQKLNLSRLPKGMYLAVIRAKTGTIVKKIEKL